MKFLTIEELARKCSRPGPQLIALAGREDKENTLCAVRLCNHLYNVGCAEIMYFSLKEDINDFLIKFPDFSFAVDDTTGLYIEELEAKVRYKKGCMPMTLIVIDYLPLLLNQSIRITRQEEIEEIVSRLKSLSEEIMVPILILIPLSKYMPMDYPILQEFNQYGHIKSLLDVIVYLEAKGNKHSIKMLKDEDSYIHYGNLSFDRDRFEVPEDFVYRNKPKGGFWASHCRAEHCWAKWCKDNDFRTCDDRVSFYFHISPTANVLTIETLEDCNKLPKRLTEYAFMRTKPLQKEAINYKECLERGIDAIEYKYDKAKKTADFSAINKIMCEWDCDSILILNPDIIELDDVV